MNKSAIFREYLKQSILVVKSAHAYLYAGAVDTGAHVLAELAFREAKRAYLMAEAQFETAFGLPIAREERPTENRKMLDSTFAFRYEINSLKLGDEYALKRSMGGLMKLYALYVGYKKSNRHTRVNREAYRELSTRNSHTVLAILCQRFFNKKACYEYGRII